MAMERNNFDFKWGVGKEVGVGHTDRGFQYYQSFTYKGEEYCLYDCAYFYSEGPYASHIGKLVKLYETPARERKVLVLWLFCPMEIRRYLGNVEPKWNELFLASGQGIGLSNTNVVEAIVGKCHVVCTSKDKRNFQASKDELEAAEYFFFRTFDVGKHIISEKFPDEIAGIKVQFLFNRIKDQNLNRSELQKQSELASVSSRIDMSTGSCSPFKIVTPTSRKTSLSQDLEEGTSILGESRSSTFENLDLKSSIESKNSHHPELQKLGEQVNVAYRIEQSIGAGSPTKNVMPASRKNSLSKDLEEDTFVLSERKSLASNNLNLKCPPVERVIKAGREMKDISKVRSRGDSLDENEQDTMPLKRRPNLVSGKNSICPKEGTFKLAMATVPQGSGAQHALGKSLKASKKFAEVTSRPGAEKRNWFKQLPWEERLQGAQEAGTLVLLENLDPSFSSFEIEDLVWHAFTEKVAARMIQSTSFSSPFNGKAFVIFKSKLAAENALSKLTSRCLILSDGRPITGRRRNLRVSNKESSFFGHLAIDRPKYQKQSYDLRIAVSTAHCSQMNTLEYEMAVEWLEQQEKSDLCWKALYKVHLKEITELKCRLKFNLSG